MGLFFRLVLFIMTSLEILTSPVYWWVYRGKKKKVPPPKSYLLKLSATDLAAKIRQKEVSSEDLVRTYINRIKEVNPIINAVVQDRYEEAIQEARNVDMYLLKSSMSDQDLEKSKPLLGVPLTVKESCGLQGLELSVGQLSRAGVKADSDGKAVSRLRASGAIPLLVSNTPELCMSFVTDNLVTGSSNNPYDSTRITAGSSGGEGALLGAGASVIGIGSDLAGSIRYPAYCNGIFGHKTTPRIVPIKGHFPILPDVTFPDLLVIGPMTRYAKDLRLMMNIIVDPQQKSLLRLNDEINFRKINVFFMEEIRAYFLPSVQPEIKKSVRKAVEYLKVKCGAFVKNKKFPGFKHAAENITPLFFQLEGFPNPLKGEKNGADDAPFQEIHELYKSITGDSKHSTPMLMTLLATKVLSTTADGIKKRNALKEEFLGALGDNGVFICPSCPVEAPRHNTFYFNTVSTVYLFPFNFFGCPATNVPCGLNRKGLPIGIQVVAGPNQDRLCLAVAEQLEKCFGGWVSP